MDTVPTGGEYNLIAPSTSFQTCSESLSDHVSGEFLKLHQLLSDRELGLKEALENQREKNLAQMETKLKELNWKVASWSETLCRVQAGLECKDHISFLKVRTMRKVRGEMGRMYCAEGKGLVETVFTCDIKKHHRLSCFKYTG